MAEQPALSEVVASIRHNLTCTFCHELLQDPRILPCLHTFCMQCIENLVRSRATATSEVSCPTCSQQVALESRAAARALPANSLLVSLLDVLSIQQGERIGCDVCDAATADADESVATVRCKECAQFMCELHAKGHKRAKDTKMHTLFSPDHLRAVSLKELHRPSYCPTHTNERLILFCDSCNASICRNCALSGHRSHQCHFVEEAHARIRPKLTDLLEKAKGLCVRVEKAVPVLDFTLQMVNAKADGALREIDGHINAKVRALEQRRKELRAAVELVRVARKTALQQQKTRLAAARDTLRGSCHFVKRALEEGDAVYLLSTKDLVCRRLEVLLAEQYEFYPREDYHLKVCCNDEHVVEAIGAYGYLDTCYAHFATSSAEGQGLGEAQLGAPAEFTVITRDRKGKIFTGDETHLEVQVEPPAGTAGVAAEISPSQQGRYLVRYSPTAVGPHRIHVTIRGFPLKHSPFMVGVRYDRRDYTEIKEPQTIIGCRGDGPGCLDGVRGVAVDSQNRIIVCDRNNCRVKVFDSAGEFLFQFGQKGAESGQFSGGPFDVAVGQTGTLIVSDWNGSSVQVFDSEGNFLNNLESARKESPRFGNFCHVAASADGRIFVSDYQNKEIQVFESSGQNLYSFSGSTTDESDGLLNGPNGITLNSKGEVIVALANDGGFQVFTQEGKLLRRINLQQTGALGEDAHAFFVPEAIAVDSEDNIFATDSNSNSLTIFSPEGNFLAQLGKPSLRNPFGVALDRLGRVVASDSSDQVKIF